MKKPTQVWFQIRQLGAAANEITRTRAFELPPLKIEWYPLIIIVKKFRKPEGSTIWKGTN